jgi:hypothetical protein
MTRDFAERCFSQIEGFGSLRLSPRATRRAFALLVYASSWLKRHHPGIFACALLNSQPMGFYAPAQIVRDAREHGVEVRPDLHQPLSLGQRDGKDRDGRFGAPPRLPADQVNAGGGGRLDRRSARQRLHGGGRCLAPRGTGGAHAHDPGGGGCVRHPWIETRREALWAARALVPKGELPLFAGDLDGEGIVEGRRDPAANDRGRRGRGGLRRHAADAAGPIPWH